MRLVVPICTIGFVQALLLTAIVGQCRALTADHLDIVGDACERDAFPDGAGVCRKCSWCRDDDPTDSDDAKRHRAWICDRHAGGCPPGTELPELRQGGQEHRRTGGTAATRQANSSQATEPSSTPNVTSTEAGPVLGADIRATDPLPFWVWILVAVLAAVGTAVACVLRKFRSGQPGKDVEGDDPSTVTDPLTGDPGEAASNTGGSLISINMAHRAQQQQVAA